MNEQQVSGHLPELTCYLQLGLSPLILPAPAPATRPWTDTTPEAFAYRCLPFNIANAHGWAADPLGGKLRPAEFLEGHLHEDIRFALDVCQSPQAKMMIVSNGLRKMEGRSCEVHVAVGSIAATRHFLIHVTEVVGRQKIFRCRPAHVSNGLDDLARLKMIEQILAENQIGGRRRLHHDVEPAKLPVREAQLVLLDQFGNNVETDEFHPWPCTWVGADPIKISARDISAKVRMPYCSVIADKVSRACRT